MHGRTMARALRRASASAPDMARQEHDREDLLAEATALVQRVELRAGGEVLVAGFRRDGSASLFFGADPVYQFNSRGQLRRAFVDGRLLKADRGRLAALTRSRTATEVALVRHDLDATQTAALLGALAVRLAGLRDALARGSFAVLRQVPADEKVVGRLADWLASLPTEIHIASSPRVQ